MGLVQQEEVRGVIVLSGNGGDRRQGKAVDLEGEKCRGMALSKRGVGLLVQGATRREGRNDDDRP
jgi:hypothetical protein